MRGASAIAVGLALLATAGCAAPDDSPTALTVYAAASLTEAFDDIENGFEAAHPGVEVTTVYGGSSSLATQIVEGAPADVFASANAAQMAVVDRELAADPLPFASNTLTLVVPSGDPAHVAGLGDLADPAVTSVICAPQVPCGAATHALADLLGLALRPSSEEGSVTDVLGKVSTGQADAGVVYVTDVARATGIEEVPIDGADAVRAVYPIAPLAGAQDPALAQQFASFVTGPEGRAVLERHGFGAP